LKLICTLTEETLKSCLKATNPDRGIETGLVEKAGILITAGLKATNPDRGIETLAVCLSLLKGLDRLKATNPDRGIETPTGLGATR